MKCTGKDCPMQYNTIDVEHCEAKGCPYRTEGLSPDELPFSDIPNTNTVLGYDADLLIKFANACHAQGITNEDLKDFANNIYYAYKLVYESIQKDWNEALNRYIHE